jgi:hypothetical protein
MGIPGIPASEGEYIPLVSHQTLSYHAGAIQVLLSEAIENIFTNGWIGLDRSER